MDPVELRARNVTLFHHSPRRFRATGPSNGGVDRLFWRGPVVHFLPLSILRLFGRTGLETWTLFGVMANRNCGTQRSGGGATARHCDQKGRYGTFPGCYTATEKPLTFGSNLLPARHRHGRDARRNCDAGTPTQRHSRRRLVLDSVGLVSWVGGRRAGPQAAWRAALPATRAAHYPILTGAHSTRLLPTRTRHGACPLVAVRQRHTHSLTGCPLLHGAWHLFWRGGPLFSS